MKTKFFASLFVGALALSGIAQKAEAKSAWRPNCWYVTGYGGPAWNREMDTRFKDPTGVNPSQSIITDYRTGYGVGGAIGAVFCRSWRLEVEGYFRDFNGKHVMANGPVTGSCTATCPASCPGGCSSIPAGCCTATASTTSVNQAFNPSTHYRSFSLMANGFYDFCLCESVAWYVGGGIGPSWVEYKVKPYGGFLFDAKTSEVRFSYQIMTGISYRFCNRMSATMGYRLWGTTEDKDGSGTIAGTFSTKVKERRVPLVNSLEFGLRYAF